MLTNQEAIINGAAQALTEADSFIISASNGFSISEGINLFADNASFQKNFGDFRAHYGVRSLLQGMGLKWPTEMMYWAFWNRLYQRYVKAYTPGMIMARLNEIVGDRPYFIITSNGESHFERAEFDAQQTWEIEGKWTMMQCGLACHNELYSAEPAFNAMAAYTDEMMVPEALVPHCPYCGASMHIHSAFEPKFVTNQAAYVRWQSFLEAHGTGHPVVLELGIGWRNQLIKAPLMDWVRHTPAARYVTINLGEVYIPKDIAMQSYGLDGTIEAMLEKLVAAMKGCVS